MELKTVTELLDKTKQLKALELEVEALKFNVQKALQEAGTENVYTNVGKVKLVKKRGKRLKASVANAELEELEAAIQLEQDEMLQVNAKELYQLEKARDMAQYKINTLLTNEWVEELKDKLEAAKETAKQDAMLSNEADNFTLQVQLPKVSPDTYVDKKWYELKVMELKLIKPKPFTRRQLNTFLVRYFESTYYIGMELEEALAIRLKEHTDYWTNA